MKLLVDTGALLALLLRNDQNHDRAVTFLQAHPDRRFVLTDLILAEVVTRLRARAGAEVAVRAGRSFLGSRRYEVLFADVRLVGSALGRMAQYDDKRLSLTDCVSFEVMDQLGLSTAFTFDRDFRDCGYDVVP